MKRIAGMLSVLLIVLFSCNSDSETKSESVASDLVDESAKNLANSLKTAADTTLAHIGDSLKAEVNSAANKMKEQAGILREKARQKADEGTEKLKESAQKIKESAKAGVEAAREQFK